MCTQMRRLITEHRWHKTLPGIRVLCEEMRVSRQTMMLALRLLEQEGVLLPVMPGKPRTINPTVEGKKKRQAGKKQQHPVVALIVWRKEHELTQTDSEVVTHLRDELVSMGYECRLIVFRDIVRRVGAKQIGNVIKQNPADLYVAVGAHGACTRVLVKLEIPVVYLGGRNVPGTGPRIAASSSQMCQAAVQHLQSLGHRRISVMLPEVLNHANRSASASEGEIRDIFKKLDLPFSGYNCPRWGKSKGEFLDALEQLFRVTPPSALVLGDVNHVTRTVSFLMRRRMRYPEDVSLVVLDNAYELDEYQPPICHVKMPTTRIAKNAAKAVSKFIHTGKLEKKLLVTPADLVMTDSIARADANKG